MSTPRDDCQQLKPKGTEASFGTAVITATILFIISILFSRVTVNLLVFVLRVVFCHTMLCVGILHYQQVLCSASSSGASSSHGRVTGDEPQGTM